MHVQVAPGYTETPWTDDAGKPRVSYKQRAILWVDADQFNCINFNITLDRPHDELAEGFYSMPGDWFKSDRGRLQVNARAISLKDRFLSKVLPAPSSASSKAAVA